MRTLTGKGANRAGEARRERCCSVWPIRLQVGGLRDTLQPLDVLTAAGVLQVTDPQWLSGNKVFLSSASFTASGCSHGTFSPDLASSSSQTEPRGDPKPPSQSLTVQFSSKHSLVSRMAVASHPPPFITVLFILSARCSACSKLVLDAGTQAGGRLMSCFKVTEGGAASLSCQYSVQRFGLSRVCWGRGCGTFWCSNILVQTDENGVISKVDDRYQLTGDILDGQMDLDILNVRRTDSGPYCCRVNVNGLFNDKKVIMNLRVVKAPPTSPPRTTATTATTTDRATERSTELRATELRATERATELGATELTTTVNWKTLLSSQLDLLRRNSTPLRSDATTVEDPLPSLSLQINAPILSLSLSILLLIAAVFLFLAFKRGISRGALKTGCLSSDEPPHIIYEIRMRRPVQENIYTLD
ncbi:T-cell immunoglobulin and mucin domain-containing protein 4 [Anableps anableps]